MGHYGGSYKVTYDLYKKYGEMRLLDTPICGERAHAGPCLYPLSAKISVGVQSAGRKFRIMSRVKAVSRGKAVVTVGTFGKHTV